MREAPPNILYMHSHDTGRYVQPYGHPVPTPNIQRLADQRVLFRKAFCAAPTCSAPRACLLTGQYGHNSGMLGLADRGWSLNDYRQHLVHPRHDAGYYSVLIGEQHIAKRPDIIGFDRVVKIATAHVQSVAPVASEVLGEPPPEPFFVSVGFLETHRDFLEPPSLRDALYSLPPPNLPDTPETRRDMAAYKATARSLDQGVGTVLEALDLHGLADDTLIIFAGMEDGSLLNAAFPELSYVFISRSDKVRQAVSLWRALQTWVWRNHDGTDGLQRMPAHRSAYSVDAIDYLLDQLRRQEDAWRGFFFRIGRRPLSLFYEDIDGDLEGSVARVLGAVGIERPADGAPIRKALTRQSNELSESWVRSYLEDVSRR